MSYDIAEKFLPLLVLAKDRDSRLALLENENLRLAGMFKNRHPKEFVLFLGFLSAWENLPYFKAEITRRSAARKRDAEAYAKQEEAIKRLNKADASGFPTIEEGRPRAVARDFRAQVMPNIVYYAKEWFEHHINAYRLIEDDVIRAALGAWMEQAVNAETGFPVRVDKHILDNVMDSLRSQSVLPVNGEEPPLWLAPTEEDPDPRDIIACRNGLLDVNSGNFSANTPRFFTRNGLPYDWEDPDLVLPPHNWLKFLNALWPASKGGAEAIAFLQEWMGLLLTGETKYQKILLLLGPGRSGKGTIVRVITELMGAANVADTSLNKMGREFGLHHAIGKRMLVVNDMRLGRHADVGAITETLLNIAGEDRVNIGRKFLGDWVGRLQTRIMLVGNLRLTLPDQSGALAMRYLPLVLTESFEGREDLELGQKLHAELPAILLWALEGLRRLRERGHFVQTSAGKTLLQDIRTQASPLKVFLRERCVLRPEASVDKEELFQAYMDWSMEEDVRDDYTMPTFARDLFTAGDNTINKARQRSADGSRPHVFTGVELRPAFRPLDYDGY